MQPNPMKPVTPIPLSQEPPLPEGCIRALFRTTPQGAFVPTFLKTRATHVLHLHLSKPVSPKQARFEEAVKRAIRSYYQGGRGGTMSIPTPCDNNLFEKIKGKPCSTYFESAVHLLHLFAEEFSKEAQDEPPSKPSKLDEDETEEHETEEDKEVAAVLEDIEFERYAEKTMRQLGCYKRGNLAKSSVPGRKYVCNATHLLYSFWTFIRNEGKEGQ